MVKQAVENELLPPTALYKQAQHELCEEATILKQFPLNKEFLV